MKAAVISERSRVGEREGPLRSGWNRRNRERARVRNRIVGRAVVIDPRHSGTRRNREWVWAEGVGAPEFRAIRHGDVDVHPA